MGILDYFKSKPKKSANTAKERLQIIVAHERSIRKGAEYLPRMKEDILNVIRKYVNISEDDINVMLETDNNDCQILELNITLPEKS